MGDFTVGANGYSPWCQGGMASIFEDSSIISCFNSSHMIESPS
jgi:hypothetical protein